MDPEVERLFRQATRLSRTHQETLARWLIESLDGRPDPAAAQAWEVEIDRRLADLDSGKVQTIGFEEFRKRLFGDSPPPPC
jgi:putative addiction module component (TIGR02574 family)